MVMTSRIVVWVAAWTIAGCSSAPTDENPSGTPSGSSAPCGCDDSEFCLAGECQPRQALGLSLYQVGDDAFAGVTTWTGEETPALTPIWSGDCILQKIGEAVYQPTPLDYGEAMLAVDEGPAAAFPPPSQGSSGLLAPEDFVVSTAGQQVATYSWTGGLDIGSGSVTITTPPAADLAPLAPLVVGQPWEVSWSSPAIEGTLEFAAVGGDDAIVCFSNGDNSIVVPAAMTSLIDTSSFADSLSDAQLLLRPETVTSTVGDVGVFGNAVRGHGLDVPLE
jgi:hypothetical protein